MKPIRKSDDFKKMSVTRTNTNVQGMNTSEKRGNHVHDSCHKKHRVERKMVTNQPDNSVLDSLSLGEEAKRVVKTICIYIYKKGKSQQSQQCEKKNNKIIIFNTAHRIKIDAYHIHRMQYCNHSVKMNGDTKHPRCARDKRRKER